MSSSSNPAKKKVKNDITTTNPNWLELPREITSNILQRLGAVEILKNARNVCPYWWNICKDPSMWRNIQMGTFHLYFEYSVRGTPDLDRLVKMCQYAVDLSSGHLEKIDIYRFGTDDLLKYIADRASNLRSIQLDSCIGISDEGWCENAKKFPLLEEVNILHGFQSTESLEAIGLSCPILKSLTFIGCYITYDDEALMIAKTMPGLRHLDIHGNSLTDVGLIAILDGCPLLESLDIRECSNLEFSGNLWKRLHNQIKDLEIRDKEFWNNFELEFAYSDSNGNTYWEIVERFSDENDDEEEDDDDDDDDDDDA